MIFEKIILINKPYFSNFFPDGQEIFHFLQKHSKIVIFEPFYDIQKPSLLYFLFYTIIYSLILKIIKKNLLIYKNEFSYISI